MSLISYLRNLCTRDNATADVAKERLQIIISHERLQRNTPDYLPKLQKEILAVIAKYVKIAEDKVHVHFERMGDNAVVLELNVTVPDEELEKT